MTTFDAGKKSLTFLLDQIEHGELALPDFQRDFVWEPSATRELVRSVMQSFPAGTLLLQQTGAKQFKPRPFTEAPPLAGEPSYLVLDGQQRLTSLSLAFSGRGAHRYFLNLAELIEDEDDLDEAVEFYPLKWVKHWATIEGQAEDLALPLSRLRTFADWRDDVLDIRATTHPDEDQRKLRKRLNELESRYIKPVEQYQFPVTTLPSDTNLDAVCTIFETLNRTGVKLSVFDLLTARGYAADVYLRDLWDQAQADFPILHEFGVDPYYLLQTVATWRRGNPRRGTVLKLDVAQEVAPDWAAAVRGVAGALTLLRDEHGVLTPRLLPYGTMLITLACAWPEVEAATGPAVGSRRSRLARWFWCATFTQRYENQPNSRTVSDVPALRAWLRGEGPEPEVLSETFDPGQWRSITVRQQALYRASLALSLRHHPRDFHQGKPLTPQRIAEEQVDDHHVFPQAYLGDTYPRTLVDCVLNHTLIDKKTNIRILAKAPSKYLAEMRAELPPDALDAILASHGLPAEATGPLETDDFDAFLDWRQERLARELEQVTGWSLDSPGGLVQG
jgi:hypothetical protein